MNKIYSEDHVLFKDEVVCVVHNEEFVYFEHVHPYVPLITCDTDEVIVAEWGEFKKITKETHPEEFV